MKHILGFKILNVMLGIYIVFEKYFHQVQNVDIHLTLKRKMSMYVVRNIVKYVILDVIYNLGCFIQPIEESLFGDKPKRLVVFDSEV